jgi:hypothetical protein
MASRKSHKKGRKTRSKNGGGPTVSKHTRKQQIHIKIDENKQKTKDHMMEVSKKVKDPKHWENRNKHYKKR